jgi:hypothetical protein
LLLAFKPQFFKPVLNKIVGVGFLLLGVFYSLYGSPFALVLSFISFFTLFGLHSESGFRNLVYAGLNILPVFGESISHFFKSFKLRKKSKGGLKLGKVFRIIFLPLFIILFFITIYSIGSSFFSEALGNITPYLTKLWKAITNYVDVAVVLVAALGILFGVLHSAKNGNTSFSKSDEAASDALTRIRKKNRPRFRNMDLKIELKSGVFLFIVLNLMLAFLLFLEIKNVWIGFTYSGEMLKGLVHEGTYTLIVSILVSILITVYYFRRNLNFIKDNSSLKMLSYIWIGLNSILVISVAVRNMYYIQHFALAYKRIGVIFFLILCLVGLITLFIKVSKVKSSYFLIRTNVLAAYVGLVALCGFNWDVIISKYNFSHYKTAFLHLPFMSSLSDKALPYLVISDEKIEEIEERQVEAIPFVKKRGYFKEVDYKYKIETRVEEFMEEYENSHWLEKTWAEKQAYEKLSSMELSLD